MSHQPRIDIIAHDLLDHQQTSGDGKCGSGILGRQRIESRKKPGDDRPDRWDEIEQQSEQSPGKKQVDPRSEEHTSELQSLMHISYAVLCLKKKIQITTTQQQKKPALTHTVTS